jgi:uncharacterized membrane protein
MLSVKNVNKIQVGILVMWCAILITGAVMDASFQRNIVFGSSKSLASNKAGRAVGEGLWISMLAILALAMMWAYTINEHGEINKDHVMAVLLLILLGVCTTAIVFSVRLGKKIGDNKVNVGMTAGMWTLYVVVCALFPLAAKLLSE